MLTYEQKLKMGRDYYYRTKESRALERLCIKYKTTREHILEILLQSCGRCRICEVWCGDLPEVLYIDHCHKTGKIRGLLCNRCNVKMTAIDSSGWVTKALQYVMETSDVSSTQAKSS